MPNEVKSWPFEGLIDRDGWELTQERGPQSTKETAKNGNLILGYEASRDGSWEWVRLGEDPQWLEMAGLSSVTNIEELPMQFRQSFEDRFMHDFNHQDLLEYLESREFGEWKIRNALDKAKRTAIAHVTIGYKARYVYGLGIQASMLKSRIKDIFRYRRALRCLSEAK